MRSFSLRALVASFAGAGLAILAVGVAAGHVQAVSQQARLFIGYPSEGSIFPPEITPPTFLWHEERDSAARWVVEVQFGDHSAPLRIDVAGEHQRMGEIDPQTAKGAQVVPLTAEQLAMRTWKPDAETWARIKQHSVKSPATFRIEGYAANGGDRPVCAGSVTITTSTDPVGAPVFYRDVPLMIPPPSEKGVIQPLPQSAIPLIKWKLRNIGDEQSHTVMQDLPTCANCHSFSRDGKTLGMDVDGPRNDKGLYALVPISKQMTISNEKVIRWSSFQENLKSDAMGPAVKRFGIMSQVSPDGRYVVTSIDPPKLGTSHDNEYRGFAAGLSNRLFNANYKNVAFSQVFFPTRGILAWYDREAKKLRPLPGADDPNFVQACAFWSPDGKYLIFSRARAQDPYPPNAPKPEYANDPREPQIQYDLYRIPFNEGRGGKAEPILGASQNGMSNNFPKVSPDGKWIVFVENKTGLPMRPDSNLYIVPFAGGKARKMRCNLSLMNSWHTFSPNGRWLAFSSKARGPYTQLMLTHIDAQGNDSPAILVENTTAANRAVNIPEFANIPQEGIEKIDPQATEFYRVASHAYDLMAENRMAEAVGVWRKAVALNPEDGIGHFAMATALSGAGEEREAAEEYRQACVLDPRNAAWLEHLGVSLEMTGDMDGAIESWRKSLEIEPASAEVETDLGGALFQSGRQAEDLRKAVGIDPKYGNAHNELGTALAQMGLIDEAVSQLQNAVKLEPDSVEYRVNLGFALGLEGDLSDAIDSLQMAVNKSDGKDWRSLAYLATAYDKAGRPSDAARTVERAIDVAVEQQDEQTASELRGALMHYEQETGNAPDR